MAETVLREAAPKDLQNVVNLIDKLAEFESDLSGMALKDKSERRRRQVEVVANAIVSPESIVLVAEKSGRLLGVYHAEINYGMGSHRGFPACHLISGYAKKSVNVLKVHNRLMEWAKEKGCETMLVTTLVKNDRTKKLFNKLGYGDTFISMTKEV